jgi:glycosyltransferase involved in cell wall biosynthesis
MLNTEKTTRTTKYKGVRIATVNGQGAEGCGVQRTSAELQLWAKKVGATVDFYSFDLKKYSRGAGHDMDIKLFNMKNIKETAENLNDNYDLVMFMSYPHNKYPHEACKAFYYDFYEKITKPQKAFYMHEIHKGNIDKVTYLVPMIVNADVVFHFDTNTWFSTTVDSLGFQKIGDRLHKYTLWMNFDELDKYRQKYLLTKKPGVVSVTRWSSLKNIRRSIDIMDSVQKKNKDWFCEVRGVERSIGAKFDILDYEKTIYVNPNGNEDNKHNGTVRVYGPVTRNEGLDLVAQHQFSTSFYSLPSKPENYGNRMEYTQIEIIGVGTIPIFDKHWAENNFLSDGRKYARVPYSAIYTDGSDTDALADDLINMSDEIKQKFIETSYDLVHKEFNADIVIPKAIDLIMSKGKNPKQMTIREMCRKFVNTEFADGIAKLEKEGKLPVLGIGEFEACSIEYLDGAKQCAVKKVKKQTGGRTKDLF